MVELFEPNLNDEIACVEREIAIRERVYPLQVKARRMKQLTADRELETMRAVLKRLKWCKARDKVEVEP